LVPQPDTLDAVVPDAALRTGDPREVSNKATKLAANASGKTKSLRWAYVGAMGLAVVGFVVAGVVLKREAPKPVAPVVVAGIECAAAEVTGSELPAGFADALGQGACARLGIELGVPWHVKGGMRLGVRANVRATNASNVTLDLRSTSIGSIRICQKCGARKYAPLSTWENSMQHLRRCSRKRSLARS
jgi:hypothetical protein